MEPTRSRDIRRPSDDDHQTDLLAGEPGRGRGPGDHFPIAGIKHEGHPDGLRNLQQMGKGSTWPDYRLENSTVRTSVRRIYQLS